MMKKVLFGLFFLAGAFVANAQKDSSSPKKRDYSKIDLSSRANDHFMIQFGWDGWSQSTDSINPSGFSRHFNFYFMLDKPFKTNPHLSVAYGLGIGSSNIFFKNTYIDLKSNSATLPFRRALPGTDSSNFKKFKLTTIFLEIPLELRFVTNPLTPDKGWKFAVGLKGGLILDAHTKGKNLVTKTGSSVYGSGYIMKEKDKKFINSTRVAATARIGIGNFSIDGSYQLTNFLKDGAGPTINPYSIGLTLSGL